MSARIVLDTNVCLDLFVFDDPWCAALHDAFGKGLEAVTREDCRDEWVRVLGYPQFALDVAGQARAVAAYDACMRVMPTIDVDLPRCKDPDDQKFLELAWTSQAGVLLTKDKELLVLATNDLTSPARDIARRYKDRWQIELFFKWIKQHLKVKRFLGRSENAVKIQILTALITYLLLALYKHAHGFTGSLWTLLSVLRASLFQRPACEQETARRRQRRQDDRARWQTELFG